MLPCPYKKFFGIECPGCGAQTAFYQVLHGNFAEAFHTYPAIYTLLVLGLLVLLNLVDKKRNYKKMVWLMVWVNVVVIFGVYILRNLSSIITHFQTIDL